MPEPAVAAGRSCGCTGFVRNRHPAVSCFRPPRRRRRIGCRVRSFADVSFWSLPQPGAPGPVPAHRSTYRTFDLRVSVSSGDDWAGANLNAKLTSGNFYVPASNNSNSPQQSFWSVAPNLQFDTFVSAPNFNSPVILGASSGSNTAVFN